MTAALAAVVVVQRNRLLKQEQDPVRQAAWDTPCGGKWWPDYNLTSRWDDTKLCVPRWEFHAAHAVLGAATTYAVRRVFHTNSVVAVASSVMLVSIIPHAIGVGTHAFDFNGRDWAANAWIASAGMMPMSAEHGAANGITGVTTWLAGYGLLYPVSSP